MRIYIIYYFLSAYLKCSVPIFAVQGFYIKNLQKIDAFSSYFKVDGAGETDEQRKKFKYVLVYL